MTAENFDLVLRELSDRMPFQVFTVKLNTGERFEVDFPQALTVNAGVAVYLGLARRIKFFDHNGDNQFIDAASHELASPSAA